MTVVDLHPEDLLDKDSRGELTGDERARLDVHLGRCAACRAERVLRLDFAEELEEDDRPSAILGLVQGALKSAETKLDAEEGARVVRIAGLRRRPRRTAVLLLCAAAVLAASAAGATGLTGRVWLQLRGTPQDATHAEPSAVLPSPTTLSTGSQDPTPIAASSTSAIAEPPDPTLTDIQAPTPIAPSPSPIRTVAFAPASASAMFDSANAARRAGDTAAALALYDSLERRFPGSREARSAKATTGRLLLDHGDAAGAVARFDGYLASGAGELREEAMAGRATALERLGHDDDESRAWALLLATYPQTPYASHARARVGRSLPR